MPEQRSPRATPRLFPVDTWEDDTHIGCPVRKPAMPEGAVELLGGDWVLRTGERVIPCYPGEETGDG